MECDSILKLDIFGKDAHFDHVGMATNSIEGLLGQNVETCVDETQKVKATFADLNGIKLEFLEPLSDDSPISASLKKNQQLLHLCFKVPDLDQAIEASRKHGFHKITQPTQAPAYGNKKIVWVFSRSFGLVELLEK